MAQAVVLEVHLDGGDAGLGAGDLEVHLAVEVLDALDVDKGGEGIAVLDEAAGDTGDRGLDGHTGVHEGEGAAADAALGGGAVGREHLAHHTDGVGEVLNAGDDGLKGLLGQGAVAVLAAAGGALGLGLAGGVAGEVVVVHIALLFLFPDGVELLGSGEGIEGGYAEHLGLAAGEEAAAVDAGDDADLGGQGTNLVHGAAVNAVALKQPLLDYLLLELVGDLLEVLVHVGVLFEEHLVPVLDELVPALLAHILVVGVHGGHGLFHSGLDYLVEQLLVEVGVLVLELGLANLLDHLVDEVEHGLNLLVGLHDALVHDVLGDLVGGGLYHDDLLVSGSDSDGHLVVLALGLGGVEEVLFAVPAEGDAGDGAVPGDVADGHGGAGAYHGGYLGGAVAVNAEDFALDGDVVAQVAREERAHRAVDQAAGQHGGQARAALTAHEAAGDAAHGVELLVEVHAEGEVVDAVARARGSGHGHEHGGLAVLGQHGGIGELAHTADLHAQRASAVVNFVYTLVGELFVLDNHKFGSFRICGQTPRCRLRRFAALLRSDRVTLPRRTQSTPSASRLAGTQNCSQTALAGSCGLPTDCSLLHLRQSTGGAWP